MRLKKHSLFQYVQLALSPKSLKPFCHQKRKQIPKATLSGETDTDSLLSNVTAHLLPSRWINKQFNRKKSWRKIQQVLHVLRRPDNKGDGAGAGKRGGGQRTWG